MTIRFRISGLAEELVAVDAALSGLIDDEAGWLRPDEQMAARLGLHELLVNVARHAYRDKGGAIDVEMRVTTDALAIDVADAGVSWSASLHGELPDGPATSGYGIPIIVAAFDDANYCRSAKRNHWALRLYHGGAWSAPA